MKTMILKTIAMSLFGFLMSSSIYAITCPTLYQLAAGASRSGKFTYTTPGTTGTLTVTINFTGGQRYVLSNLYNSTSSAALSTINTNIKNYQGTNQSLASICQNNLNLLTTFINYFKSMPAGTLVSNANPPYCTYRSQFNDLNSNWNTPNSIIINSNCYMSVNQSRGYIFPMSTIETMIQKISLGQSGLEQVKLNIN